MTMTEPLFLLRSPLLRYLISINRLMLRQCNCIPILSPPNDISMTKPIQLNSIIQLRHVRPLHIEVRVATQFHRVAIQFHGVAFSFKLAIP